jgi:hypothetical protein
MLSEVSKMMMTIIIVIVTVIQEACTITISNAMYRIVSVWCVVFLKPKPLYNPLHKVSNVHKCYADSETAKLVAYLITLSMLQISTRNALFRLIFSRNF